MECRVQAARLASHRCKMDALELQRKLKDPGAAHTNAHTNAGALAAHLASVTERKEDAMEQYTGKAKRLKVGALKGRLPFVHQSLSWQPNRCYAK